MNVETIGLISIFTGGLPAFAGMIVFYKAAFKHRMLAFFILYAFLSDVAKWQFYEHNYTLAQNSIFYIYSLIEPVFFCWFIYKSCDFKPVSQIALLLAFALPLLWIFTHFDFILFTWKKNMSEAMFNTIYGMIISVLASYNILRFTQKDEPLLSIPDFWFLLAIFFYFFCTFFVKAFLQTPQMNEFWFIHDLFNIMTCFIFTFGFYTIEKNSSKN